MISISLLICVGVILSQVNFMKTTNLGFNHEHLIQIYAGNSYQNGKYEDFKTALKEHHNIVRIGGANQISGREASGWRPFSIIGDKATEEEVLPIMIVDEDYFNTLEVNFIAGRNFSNEYPSDKQKSYIVNEAAVNKYAIEEPVGTQIQSWTMTDHGQWYEKNGELIGVVKNYNLTSLQKKVQPVLFYMHSDKTNSISSMLIRITGNDIKNTLDFIEKKYAEYQPDIPFDYAFLEDSMNDWYLNEERFLRILTIFVLIAIVIAVLGIYGLSGYSVQQRTQEIGIRKVLGASPLQITHLISKKYVINLIVANIFAWPVGYYMMQKWLQNFAFRIHLNIFYFIIAGSIAFTIAILTISIQALKITNSNPADALKYE